MLFRFLHAASDPTAGTQSRCRVEDRLRQKGRKVVLFDSEIDRDLEATDRVPVDHVEVTLSEELSDTETV